MINLNIESDLFEDSLLSVKGFVPRRISKDSLPKSYFQPFMGHPFRDRVNIVCIRQTLYVLRNRSCCVDSPCKNNQSEVTLRDAAVRWLCIFVRVLQGSSTKLLYKTVYYIPIRVFGDKIKTVMVIPWNTKKALCGFMFYFVKQLQILLILTNWE